MPLGWHLPPGRRAGAGAGAGADAGFGACVRAHARVCVCGWVPHRVVPVLRCVRVTWQHALEDPHSGIIEYFWALGTPADPEKYVARASTGLTTEGTFHGAFTPGDDVLATVWAQNGMFLEAHTTSRWLRVDPGYPIPAAPLAVRDLALGSDADADIDYQTSELDLRVGWAGWWSRYGWIAGYHLALEAFDGAGPVTVCAGAMVGNETEFRYSAPVPGCATAPLQHGWTYLWRVRAVGCNGLTRSMVSDGVTVDATPPDLGLTEVRDGATGQREIDWQSHELLVLSANWRGAIREEESPIAYLEWALGTTEGGADVMPWTVVRATCSPDATWCAHCGPELPDACAAPGTDVCIRVRYRMCAGQWGGLSTTYCRRWTPGCEGPVTFALQAHDSPEGLLGYRVYRVDPDDEDRGCLKV